ncbi:hypothetical protein [Wolbachia endosymbiont (group A) of Agelastica alni]|uniref:hypothetical protein n=1 Tax=Wolbachia endosymbiont (group A) of Agelastica alni TaxID=3066130 RepID=UPI003133187E
MSGHWDDEKGEHLRTLTLSFQRVTLESSSYCTFTWCRVKFPGSQCLGTGMTPFWMESYFHDIIIK